LKSNLAVLVALLIKFLLKFVILVRVALAMRWIIEAARKTRGKRYETSLSCRSFRCGAKIAVMLSKRKKILTEWLRQIKHLLTSVGRLID
jgi:uncharacterized membrane protein YoaK (UPF0700 family)